MGTTLYSWTKATRIRSWIAVVVVEALLQCGEPVPDLLWGEARERDAIALVMCATGRNGSRRPPSISVGRIEWAGDMDDGRVPGGVRARPIAPSGKASRFFSAESICTGA